MKRFTYSLIMLCTTYSLHAQEDKRHDDIVPTDTKVEFYKTEYRLKSTTTLKYIKCNVHFICRDDGTGNFNGTCDNTSEFSKDATNGWTFYSNGYDFATKLIDKANARLLNNTPSNYPRDNTNAPEIYLQLRLTSVLYHYDTDLYNDGSSGDVTSLLTNSGEEENIFICGCIGGTNTCSYGGSAGYYSSYTRLGGYWNYLVQNTCSIPGVSSTCVDEGVRNWMLGQFAGNVIHELGHTLNLPHPFGAHTSAAPQTGCYTEDDWIDDTPTWPEFQAEYSEYNLQDCGRWAIPTPAIIYNNSMHNSESNSLTQGQIDEIHNTLTNTNYKYRRCDGDRPTLSYYDGNLSNKSKEDYAAIIGENYNAYVNSGTSFNLKANNILIKDFHANVGSSCLITKGNFCPPSAIHMKSAKENLQSLTDEKKDIRENIDNETTIYPNPSDNIFNIQKNGNASFSYKVYNSMGTLILEKTNVTNDKFDLTGNPSGIYYIQIIGNSTEVKKIILR